MNLASIFPNSNSKDLENEIKRIHFNSINNVKYIGINTMKLMLDFYIENCKSSVKRKKV